MNKTLANAKIAIYYDWLNYQYGGAEKVLLNILTLFPNAEIFTMFYDKNKCDWLPKNIKIHTSFLQKFPRSNLLSPIYDIAAESFNFNNFDIVISTTSNLGHCLITNPQTLFVCYYHNLNRHLYLKQPRLLKPLLNFYQKIDKIYAKRPDVTLCNSKTTSQRLNKFLNQNSKIISPGIDTKLFVPVLKPTNDYFLIVGRLVPHKNIDYAIRAFMGLNSKLIIAGSGRDSKRLQKIADRANNIIFTGQVNDRQLLKLYQNCTALICPQIEDFGLVSIEAQSCGRPVITFNSGGITETVINHQTGLFYNLQNETSLIQAINDFSTILFDNKFISNRAKQFDESIFMLNFKKEINHLWQQHQNNYL